MTTCLSKRKRIVDPKAMLRVRLYANKKCEYCDRTCDVDPHHIKSKGSGGDDIEENLIGLCRECHGLAQDYKIPRAILFEIALADGRPERIRAAYKGFSTKKLYQELAAA